MFLDGTGSRLGKPLTSPATYLAVGDSGIGTDVDFGDTGLAIFPTEPS